MLLINTDGCRRRDLMKWPNTADSIPREFVKRGFAFAFVALEESWDEELVRQRGQFDTTCFAMANDDV